VCHHAETTSTVYVVKMPRKDAIGHPLLAHCTEVNPIEPAMAVPG
jgi:hypothetical protein